MHLLRRVPPSAIALYYAGTIPFVLALLFFWARTTWFQPTDDSIAWGALGLVVLFLFMKAMQAEFCARLLAWRRGGVVPAWSWRRFLRAGEAQLRIQPWALVAAIGSSVAAFPFGWVYAYAQIVTVIGEDERLHAVAVEEARLWPVQNHVALGLLAVLGLTVWLNLAGAFVAIPWLANRLLGIDNIFGFSGWWFFNTTFLASVTGLTWLAVDPVIKAFYTVWVFHGRSRRTGEDLQFEFHRAARLTPAAVRVALLAAVFFAMAPGLRLGAAEPAKAPVVQPAQLDRAIGDVLAGSDFAWRMRVQHDVKPQAENQGPLARFLSKGVEIMRTALRAIGEQVRRAVDWLVRRFSPKPRESTMNSAMTAAAVLRVLMYVLLGGVALLLLWLVWIVVRQIQRSSTPVLSAEAVTAAAPDLRDENVHAAQLPADGWLTLARNEAARGEWRLAFRALYLAMLAQTAAEGLISLAKHKTNLDYERELERRALSRGGIVARFSGRRRQFDAIWYGREVAVETDVRGWLAEFDRPGLP